MEALGCRAVPSNRPQVCSISFDLCSFLTIARYVQTSFPNILSRRIQRRAIITEAQSLTKSYSAMAPEMVLDRYSKSCQRTIFRLFEWCPGKADGLIAKDCLLTLVKSRLALGSPGCLVVCSSPCRKWLNTQKIAVDSAQYSPLHLSTVYYSPPQPNSA